MPPRLIGKIWCTSSTGVMRPSSRHRSHSGCDATYLARILCQARPYFFAVSGERLYLSYFCRASFLCSSQYCPSVRFGHPGYAHGRFGFWGIILIPFIENRPRKCYNAVSIIPKAANTRRKELAPITVFDGVQNLPLHLFAKIMGVVLKDGSR